MRLISLFEQRPIGKTYGSIRSRIPLRTPSGPQLTESELETELVEQLNFSTRVIDIITQPIIRYKKGDLDRRYTPDVVFEVYPDATRTWRYYVIEIKKEADLRINKAKYEEKFAVGRDWCAQNFMNFRVIAEKHLRTPYLRNTRLLSQQFRREPDHNHLSALLSVTAGAPTRIADAINAMIRAGFNEPLCRETIERAVANRFVECDLSIPFTDDSILFTADVNLADSTDRDPILKAIRTAETP
ncbi:TnsA endonuclease N-terminal domain-containing protein [Rhodoblastus sp.]|jgi:hypothetical protein|uniref:TnsA endonuclease N-terminal domain-containing protein n=1 Tax=Rhodoblastus sp. TaxID=1962975 RepID=UPI0025FD4CB1|nr:TnsA endonuclease N-terminal domain-containing protein [Rhodoblastus sp.]